MTFLSFAERGVRQVSVDNLGSGSLTVDPTSGDELTGSLNCSDPDYLAAVAVRTDGDRVRIELPRSFGPDSAVQIQLMAPAGIDYVIGAGSADVAIDAEAGRVQVSNGSGDVSVRSATELSITNGSGDSIVERVTGRSARVTSGSGQIRIGETAAAVDAKSGSGDITVRSLRGELQGATGSGDISVPSTTGSVDLRSASGSLTVGVASDLPAWLDLNSVTGAIRIALDATAQPESGQPYVSIRARTASGEIAVYRA